MIWKAFSWKEETVLNGAKGNTSDKKNSKK